MPFKSDKQRRFMFARYPEIARKWVEESKVKEVKKQKSGRRPGRGNNARNQ